MSLDAANFLAAEAMVCGGCAVVNLDSAYGILGIAMKAGQVVSGEAAVEKAIKSGEAKLTLICDTASQNTKKAIIDASKYRNVPCRIMEGARLGRSIGKPARKVAAVVGGMAEQVTRYLE